VLVVGAFFSFYTYISPFLTKVSGLPAHDVAPVLLVGGLTSTVGVGATGMLFDRFSRAFTVGPVALIAGGLLGLWALRHTPAAAVVMAGLVNMGMGAFVIANQSRVLIVAPGSSDVASAWASASFNVGIGGGSLVGSLVVAVAGTSQTALVGGLLGGAALVVVMVDQLAHPGPQAAHDHPFGAALVAEAPGR
jgi:MFS transporter, DHA1 family, inner membrane transport protein